MIEQRVGALYVLSNVPDQDWINRRLHALDRNLFVEKQLTFADEQVWCVVEDTGEHRGAERYLTVYEWRGPDGKPLEYLSEGIVDEMQRRAQTGTGNIREAGKIVQARNRQRLERLRANAQEQSADIARDFGRHATGGVLDAPGGHFAIVPRSPGLARARARARSNKAEQLRAVREALTIARAVQRKGNRAALAGT